MTDPGRLKYKHCCPEWDYLEIQKGDPEFEACICVFASQTSQDTPATPEPSVTTRDQ